MIFFYWSASYPPGHKQTLHLNVKNLYRVTRLQSQNSLRVQSECFFFSYWMILHERCDSIRENEQRCWLFFSHIFKKYCWIPVVSEENAGRSQHIQTSTLAGSEVSNVMLSWKSNWWLWFVCNEWIYCVHSEETCEFSWVLSLVESAFICGIHRGIFPFTIDLKVLLNFQYFFKSQPLWGLVGNKKIKFKKHTIQLSKEMFGHDLCHLQFIENKVYNPIYFGS